MGDRTSSVAGRGRDSGIAASSVRPEKSGDGTVLPGRSNQSAALLPGAVQGGGDFARGQFRRG